MTIKTARLMIVLLGTIFVFGQMCIAGTWTDDFSDPTLRDWDGGLRNDEVSATVVGGHFYYRGKDQLARHNMENRGLGKIQDFSLELKFMFRNLRVPQGSYWVIMYALFDEETWDYDGIIEFLWYPNIEKPNIMEVTIDRFERGVLEWLPEAGEIWIPNTAAIDSFAYEEKVWYTLRIEREGNQYTFSMGDVILFAEDDAVPMGTIELIFNGRNTIWLDDFSVTGPDVPNGGPGFLGVNPLAEQLTTTWGKLKAQN
ncbi:MAG: hypothetical protein OXP71_17070 [Candidatus Poribacteria bacterium]|nr:hypothetical protein [Candidatus Poribacteria bacterium]